jgi:3-oxoacyl-[acyl-carrier protein] reductase
MIAPLMMIRAVLPGMKERRFGRIVNITSAMVTTPRPHMTVSSGARAGLTAAMKGLSLEVARHNVTINNLLPERFDTDRQHQMAKAAMARENISYEEARARQVESIAARRLGDPKEFGATCAFLCSAFAGFMSGQNLHLDGGSYPALI